MPRILVGRGPETLLFQPTYVSMTQKNCFIIAVFYHLAKARKVIFKRMHWLFASQISCFHHALDCPKPHRPWGGSPWSAPLFLGEPRNGPPTIPLSVCVGFNRIKMPWLDGFRGPFFNCTAVGPLISPFWVVGRFRPRPRPKILKYMIYKKEKPGTCEKSNRHSYYMGLCDIRAMLQAESGKEAVDAC